MSVCRRVPVLVSVCWASAGVVFCCICMLCMAVLFALLFGFVALSVMVSIMVLDSQRMDRAALSACARIVYVYLVHYYCIRSARYVAPPVCIIMYRISFS